MPTRLLHVSDLHMGTEEDSAFGTALLSLAQELDPELVVASGDLTHRGRTDQHAAAARLLRSLGKPVLAVPGNHDLPYLHPDRLTRPYARFEHEWGATEPSYSSASFQVVGLNSARPWPSQAGLVTRSQLTRVARRLAEAGDGALRVVVLHHHLIGAPWRSWKLPVLHRSRVLGRLVDSGAELILAGHVHQAAVSERGEFEVVRGGAPGVVVSTAPGLGQPRPRRRGEARGLHVYEPEADALSVATYVWRDGDWALIARRRFPRGREPLTAAPGA